MRMKKAITGASERELVEAYVFPVTLTPEEREEASQSLSAARAKRQSERTDGERLVLRLLQLKLQLEDYLSTQQFDPQKRFGTFLRQYVALQNKNQKTFAAEIDINETEFSSILNHRREPTHAMLIRLELHSNQVIPALDWYRLVGLEREYKLSTDSQARAQEAKHVHRKLDVSIG